MPLDRTMEFRVLDFTLPVRVPAGCEVMVTLTLVEPDGTSQKLCEAPISAMNPHAPLVHAVRFVEETD